MTTPWTRCPCAAALPALDDALADDGRRRARRAARHRQDDAGAAGAGRAPVAGRRAGCWSPSRGGSRRGRRRGGWRGCWASRSARASGSPCAASAGRAAARAVEVVTTGCAAAAAAARPGAGRRRRRGARRVPRAASGRGHARSPSCWTYGARCGPSCGWSRRRRRRDTRGRGRGCSAGRPVVEAQGVLAPGGGGVGAAAAAGAAAARDAGGPGAARRMWRRWCGGRSPSGTGDVLCFLPGRRARSPGWPGSWRGLAAWTCSRCTGGRPRPCRTRCCAPGADGAGWCSRPPWPSPRLTVPGVRVVVDAGLAREPRTDHARGLSALTTVRASRAAGRQRAGRAGREAPGAVYRCWAEAEDERLPALPVAGDRGGRPDGVRAAGGLLGRPGRVAGWRCSTRRRPGRWRRPARC